ncbi:MAG TPA: antitoxin, partial [Actinomycetota bacterium]|nr:antitoxin [Actinomycetota bacterium]
MGFLDKAKDLLGKHEEKVEDAIEKVADLVDDK